MIYLHHRVGRGVYVPGSSHFSGSVHPLSLVAEIQIMVGSKVDVGRQYASLERYKDSILQLLSDALSQSKHHNWSHTLMHCAIIFVIVLVSFGVWTSKYLHKCLNYYYINRFYIVLCFIIIDIIINTCYNIFVKHTSSRIESAHRIYTIYFFVRTVRRSRRLYGTSVLRFNNDKPYRAPTTKIPYGGPVVVLLTPRNLNHG
ncbi:hypothetical protein AGLY_001500 [Aphis glycines]|uniref:Uncharacterized protein n=1 Tax=Aphis glycines TaxID=307491 RepID=A0A6G0U5C3_APHGL|nr:hypothetical protein AGLY_001500 [Aphis glycines]